jgi:putative peptidoglycan lipid II flippase
MVDTMILKNSSIIAFFSILSLLLGIFRDRFLSVYVGVGPVLDIYNASFRIPDLLFGVMASFVSSSIVVPFLTKEIHNNDKRNLERKFNSLFFFFALVMLVLSIVIFIILPYISAYIFPSFSEEQLSLFVTSTRILLVQPILLGLSTLISCLAQARHRFILFSITPIVYTLCIIFSIKYFYSSYGLLGIMWGVVLGAAIHLVLQSYTLFELNIKLNKNLFSKTLVLEHLHFAIPRSGSHIISQIRSLIFATVALQMGIGILSIYIFAQRILDAFIQVVIQSVSGATIPILSKHQMFDEHKEYKNVFTRIITAIILLSLLMQGISYFFGKEIVEMIYGNTSAVDEIYNLFIMLIITLPLYAVNAYLVNAFAGKKPKSLFYANLVSSIITIIVLYLTAHLGIVSFAYATWTVGISYFLLLLFFYKRKEVLNN